MDNTNYSPSELIDLALDCELDSSQANSLFELLARDNALQEEFRQAIAIRRALNNDVLAGIPSMEFTQSLFQQAGVGMPGNVSPSFLARSGLKLASLATTAVVFMGIGIITTMGIDKLYSGKQAEIQNPINLPKLYSMEVSPDIASTTNINNQLTNYAKTILSPFHTPTYHHDQKTSKGTTDGVIMLPENIGAELSVGLSSEKIPEVESQNHQNLLPTTVGVLENTILKNVETNFLDIEKESITDEYAGGRILLPALDFSSIRGKYDIIKYGSLGSELPPVEGRKNRVVTDSKYALEFNGTNDHIVIENIPKSIELNSTTTAWVYKITEAVNQQWIVGMGARQSLVVQKDGHVAMTNYLAKGRSENKLDTGYWCSVADPEKIQLNTWVHYAGVVETDSKKTTLKLYRNGELINQQSFDYTVNGNPGCDGFIGGVHIGYKSPECYFTYSQSFIGQIDEISIWERALSQTDIFDIMQRKLNLDEEGLIGYWPFEEGSGILSKDKSKYSNHASLMLGASWVKLR